MAVSAIHREAVERSLLDSLLLGQTHTYSLVQNTVSRWAQDTGLTDELPLSVREVLLVHHILGVPRATLAGQGSCKQGGEPADAPSQADNQSRTRHL